ncbi:Dabb family protein [Saccharothrix syringae]|uniref:Dabb family protein n=1 Tax=Saccharothrix syringae TaxID=103733 RepID=A0A5Q0GYG9_SACSY|nr:Dabb family protein [Saccharothrix syringae]QFZ19116.1 Dabb family protein [Saccharothrix syringae]
MIRHIVLFKFKPGVSWDDDAVLAAEAVARRVGDEVPDLAHWYAGRNVSDRPVAYDFVVIGLLADEDALGRYMTHPFHQDAIARWREISDWVVADVVEQDATVVTNDVPVPAAS